MDYVNIYYKVIKYIKLLAVDNITLLKEYTVLISSP